MSMRDYELNSPYYAPFTKWADLPRRSWQIDFDRHAIRDELFKGCERDGEFFSVHFNMEQLIENIRSLTAHAPHPEFLCFLWRSVGNYVLDQPQPMRDHLSDNYFLEALWDEQKQSIFEYIKTAPFDFLIYYSSKFAKFPFEYDVLTETALQALADFDQDLNTREVALLYDRFLNLRIMPPTSALNHLLPSQSADDDLNLIRIASKAGITLPAHILSDNIPQGDITRINDAEYNNLWSLSAQFSFAAKVSAGENENMTLPIEDLYNKLAAADPDNSSKNRGINAMNIIFGNDVVDLEPDPLDRASTLEINFFKAIRDYFKARGWFSEFDFEEYDRFVPALGRNVDGHFRINDRPVILEVDGPYHYLWSPISGQDEPNGSTKMQTHLLETLFPDHAILRVHHALVQALTQATKHGALEPFDDFFGMIEDLKSVGYYMSMNQNQVRVENSQDLQLRHNFENKIKRPLIQM